MLLEHGADPNAVGEVFDTVLMAAARSMSGGGQKIIQLLLYKGANINSTDGMWSGDLNSHETYCTPLQIACSTDELFWVRFLLARGTDPNVSGGTLGNALQIAAAGAMTLIMQTLIENGTDVHAQGGKYENVLQAAARANRGRSIESIRLLLDHGMDINMQGGKYGNSSKQSRRYTSPGKKSSGFCWKRVRM